MEFLFNRVCGLELSTDGVGEHIPVGDTLFKIFRQVGFTESFQPDKAFSKLRFNRNVLPSLDFITTLLQLGKQILKSLTRIHQPVNIQLDFLADALGLNRSVRSRYCRSGFLRIVGNMESCPLLALSVRLLGVSLLPPLSEIVVIKEKDQRRNCRSLVLCSVYGLLDKLEQLR